MMASQEARQVLEHEVSRLRSGAGGWGGRSPQALRLAEAIEVMLSAPASGSAPQASDVIPAGSPPPSADSDEPRHRAAYVRRVVLDAIDVAYDNNAILTGEDREAIATRVADRLAPRGL